MLFHLCGRGTRYGIFVAEGLARWLGDDDFFSARGTFDGRACAGRIDGQFLVAVATINMNIHNRSIVVVARGL